MWGWCAEQEMRAFHRNCAIFRPIFIYVWRTRFWGICLNLPLGGPIIYRLVKLLITAELLHIRLRNLLSVDSPKVSNVFDVTNLCFSKQEVCQPFWVLTKSVVSLLKFSPIIMKFVSQQILNLYTKPVSQICNEQNDWCISQKNWWQSYKTDHVSGMLLCIEMKLNLAHTVC